MPLAYTSQEIYWGVPWALMLRAKDRLDVDIQIADVYSVDVTIWEIGKWDRRENASFDPADVIFDTLQTGMGWDVAAKPAGFNFRAPFDGTLTPKPDKRYRHLVEFEMQDGSTLRHLHDALTFPLTKVGG